MLASLKVVFRSKWYRMSKTQRMMVKVVGVWAGVENPNWKSEISWVMMKSFSVGDRLTRSWKMSTRGWWSRI